MERHCERCTHPSGSQRLCTACEARFQDALERAVNDIVEHPWRRHYLPELLAHEFPCPARIRDEIQALDGAPIVTGQASFSHVYTAREVNAAASFTMFLTIVAAGALVFALLWSWLW